MASWQPAACQRITLVRQAHMKADKHQHPVGAEDARARRAGPGQPRRRGPAAGHGARLLRPPDRRGRRGARRGGPAARPRRRAGLGQREAAAAATGRRARGPLLPRLRRAEAPGPLARVPPRRRGPLPRLRAQQGAEDGARGPADGEGTAGSRRDGVGVDRARRGDAQALPRGARRGLRRLRAHLGHDAAPRALRRARAAHRADDVPDPDDAVRPRGARPRGQLRAPRAAEAAERRALRAPRDPQGQHVLRGDARRLRGRREGALPRRLREDLGCETARFFCGTDGWFAQAARPTSTTGSTA